MIDFVWKVFPGHYRGDRPTARMAKYDTQRHMKVLDGILDRAKFGLAQHIAGDPHHKQVSQSLIKKNFRRNA